ncbi:DMT family transporter [Secundilactobacillus collinoides]|uniref:DMT family transporter n=1 Tax=Secundilactobacillus collinoides TaxID=33960 RepID=UPI000704A72D|nr:multidrug efflux SMR transporter [Secundilactobacillus collinoides]
MLKYYGALGVAIVSEILGTMTLKYSAGFTRLWWSLASVAMYVMMLYFLSFAIRVVPLSVAYGLWSGIGTILTAVMSVVLFHEVLTLGETAGLIILVIGVLVLNRSGEHEEEIDYEELQIQEEFHQR